MKNQLYTICLGFALNLFELEYKTFGRYVETLNKIR